MNTFYNKTNGNFTVSKNFLIGLLFLAVVIMGGKLAYDNFGDPKVQDKTYVDEFDMIDPDNPMTKSDNLIRLKKKTKDLEKERYSCNEYIERAKYSMAEQTKHSFTMPFNDGDALTMEAIDFMSFYYRFPFFIQEDNTNTVYIYKPENVGNASNENVKSIVERVKMEYTSILLSHFRGANVWPAPDPSGLLDFRKQNLNFPYKGEALENLPEETTRTFEELVKKLENKRMAIDNDMVATSAEYESRMQEYKATRYDMSGKAISWGIVAFVLTALTLYMAGLRSRDKLRSRFAGEISPILHEELKMSRWYSVYLITVLLLIITIFVLGLARLLSENTLAALLGGIAGYVLNNKQSEGSPKNFAAFVKAPANTDETAVDAMKKETPNTGGDASEPKDSDQEKES